jgi:uncharacterized membrane protein YeaQ/YmgE (transglycosylase-associated protein family)
VRAIFLLLLVTVAWTGSTSAQTRLSGPAASVLFDTGHRDRALSLPWEVPDTAKVIQPTHWKEGALIGGVLGLIPGALLGHAICENSEDPDANCTVWTILGGLGGAILLGFPGALIGGQFPKHQAADTAGTE